jgi:hypothetical protein
MGIRDGGGGCRGRGKGDPPEKGNLYIVDAIPFLPVINNG